MQCHPCVPKQFQQGEVSMFVPIIAAIESTFKSFQWGLQGPNAMKILFLNSDYGHIREAVDVQNVNFQGTVPLTPNSASWWNEIYGDWQHLPVESRTTRPCSLSLHQFSIRKEVGRWLDG